MRVELASGERPFAGYLHCDRRALPPTDVVCTVDQLPFLEDSLESLLACHIIEHFPYAQIRDVLSEWRRALAPGGDITVVTPNFEFITRGYEEGWLSYNEARGRLFGGQNYPGNFHYTIFDSASLSAALKEAGFRRIRDVSSEYEGRSVPMTIYFRAEK